MGILNITSDSFSDGGFFMGREAALAQARRMAEEGAQIIDVGGESTRPGAEPVSVKEEMTRVIPVIRTLAGDERFVISIDTMKPEVALAALESGASIVNDVGGLRLDAMRELVRDMDAGAIAMHMQGEPRTMQVAPSYADATGEIRDFFRQTFDRCIASGMDPQRLTFDPGLGFGKTVAHNLELLRNLREMDVAGRPLVMGASRKSFLGKIIGSPLPEDREWPGIALTSLGRSKGARIFRVHAVKPHLDALRMTEAILAA